MDRSHPIRFPRQRIDAAEVALLEVDAAIELVLRGHARRVQLAAIDGAEPLASLAVARAQAAHVRFSVERTPSGVALNIGPREGPA